MNAVALSGRVARDAEAVGDSVYLIVAFAHPHAASLNPDNNPHVGFGRVLVRPPLDGLAMSFHKGDAIEVVGRLVATGPESSKIGLLAAKISRSTNPADVHVDIRMGRAQGDDRALDPDAVGHAFRVALPRGRGRGRLTTGASR